MSKFQATIVTLFLVLMATSCGDEATDGSAAPQQEANVPTGVRILHSLDSIAGDLNIVFRDAAGGNISEDGVKFRRATPYLDLTPGIYTVIFFDATTDQALADLTIDAFNVEEGATKTLILSEEEDGAARVHIIPEVLSAPSENSARLRFLHHAKAPTVDIYNQADGFRHATSLKHGQLTQYFELPGDPYTFEVFAEGSVTEKLADLNDIALLPAHVYSIVLLGGEAGITTLVLTDTSF
jgi:hypothetical protein